MLYTTPNYSIDECLVRIQARDSGRYIQIIVTKDDLDDFRKTI